MAKKSQTNEATATRAISPEDLTSGDYVSILRRSLEIPSIFTCREVVGDPEHSFRVTWIPCESKPPYRVSEVCLPFILVKTYDGNYLQLDVRTVQLGRLSPEYARRARRLHRKQANANSKSRRRS